MQEFDYLNPNSLKEASRILKDTDSLLLAGGTDLLGLLKDDIVSTGSLVNLKNLEGLDKIQYDSKSGLTIGALVKLADLAQHPDVKRGFSAITEAVEQISTPQLRNIGTVGGNLCQRPRCQYFRGDFFCRRKGGDTCFALDGDNREHCIVGGGPCVMVHPSDLAVVFLAFSAFVSIFNGKKVAEMPISEFFVEPDDNIEVETIVKPGEIVTAIRIPPLPVGTVSGYSKFRQRDSWDFAIVSVAAVLQKGIETQSSGRIAFGGVSPFPWTDAELNRRLTEMSWNSSGISAFTSTIFKSAYPLDHNEYKISLARSLTNRLLNKLTGV